MDDPPGQFIGFGGVDPKQGKLAVKEAVRCIEELGLKGFKFHPPTQAFEPNNPDYYELWGTISDLGVPALFHTGQTGVGAGQPGQNGIKNKYGRPYPYFDDIAADFPHLQIIMAHPSFPWVDEQLSICSVKTNVWHGPLRLVAEVLQPEPHPVREHAAQGQGDVRQRLPRDHAGPLAA